MVEAAAQTGLAGQEGAQAPEGQTPVAPAQQQQTQEQIFIRVNEMLQQSNQPALSEEQMRAFDVVWSEPTTQNLCFQDNEQLARFSEQMVRGDPAYKAQMQERLKTIFLQHDPESNGILQMEEALAFMKQALAALQELPEPDAEV